LRLTIAEGKILGVAGIVYPIKHYFWNQFEPFRNSLSLSLLDKSRMSSSTAPFLPIQIRLISAKKGHRELFKEVRLDLPDLKVYTCPCNDKHH
jgi:hypothetical protein